MSTPASAHPRLSPSGQRVVAGERVIVVDFLIEVGPGTSAQWADEGRLYYIRQPDGAFVTTIVGSGNVHVVREAGFNNFSAKGVDHWAGYRAGVGFGTVFSNGARLEDLSDPALSEDRAVWAARVIDGGAVQTESGRPRRYADRDCGELRYARQALAWMTFIDGRRQVAGRRHQLETPTLLSLDQHEGWPVPFYVGDELWLLTLGADRLLLRPWGETHGYQVAPAPTFEPDAAGLPDGRIRVVWDAGHNIFGERVIDPRTHRVDLRGPIVVVPPVDPPTNPPVEPPKETPVQLEPKHSALIEAFAARFPPPGGDEDALREHWTPRLVEQFVFSFPGEGWCWKSTSPGSRPSSDVIARRAGGGMWGYDLIPSAGTPNWSLNSHAGPIDLRTQAPITMNPVNHLGATPPVEPVPGPAPGPVPGPAPTPCKFVPTPVVVDLTPVLEEITHLRNQLQAAIERNEDLQHTTRAEVKQAVTDAVTAIIARIDRGVRIRFAAGEPDGLGVAGAADDERSRASRVLDFLESLLPVLRVLAGRD